MSRLRRYGAFLVLIFVAFVASDLVNRCMWAAAGAARVATKNGDVNGDGQRDITDCVHMLEWLFRSGEEPVAFTKEGGGLTPEEQEILAHAARVLKYFDVVELSPGGPNAPLGLATGPTVVIEGANLQIVNGLGATNGNPADPLSVSPRATPTNGLGNLIVGYQESRGRGKDKRHGSHNVVVGMWNDYTRYGGIVAGQSNTINGVYSSVLCGQLNSALGDFSAVSGGWSATASGERSAVSGGTRNDAVGKACSVSGGSNNVAGNEDDPEDAFASNATVSGGNKNIARGSASAVSGGEWNTASGEGASVTGGLENRARGSSSVITAGRWNVADGAYSAVLGGGFENELFGNKAVGEFSVIAGGLLNEAGDQTSILGGQQHKVFGQFSTVAGGVGHQGKTNFVTYLGGSGNVGTAEHAVLIGGSGITGGTRHRTTTGELELKP